MGETEAEEQTEQLELIRSRLPRRPRRVASVEAAAEVDPVASVHVDTGLAHLDRPFEYSVPESLAETAQPGVRVKVRFAGQDLDGFVLERKPGAEHEGRLAPAAPGRLARAGARPQRPGRCAGHGPAVCRHAG